MENIHVVKATVGHLVNDTADKDLCDTDWVQIATCLNTWEVALEWITEIQIYNRFQKGGVRECLIRAKHPQVLSAISGFMIYFEFGDKMETTQKWSWVTRWF